MDLVLRQPYRSPQQTGRVFALCTLFPKQRTDDDNCSAPVNYVNTQNFSGSTRMRGGRECQPDSQLHPGAGGQDRYRKRMQSKGLTKVQKTEPDMILVAAAVRSNRRLQRLGRRAALWRDGHITPQQSTEGTLIVNLYDAKARQLVWRGIAQGTLSNNGDKNQNLVHKAVEKMFKKYPKT